MSTLCFSPLRCPSSPGIPAGVLALVSLGSADCGWDQRSSTAGVPRGCDKSIAQEACAPPPPPFLVFFVGGACACAGRAARHDEPRARGAWATSCSILLAHPLPCMGAAPAWLGRAELCCCCKTAAGCGAPLANQGVLREARGWLGSRKAVITIIGCLPSYLGARTVCNWHGSVHAGATRTGHL